MNPIIIQVGEAKTIFYHINLKGRLFFKILNESGTNKITCKWIKGPFGSAEQVGEIVGSGELDIKGFIWGKLKAYNADSNTKVYITESAQIAASFPDIHF